MMFRERFIHSVTALTASLTALLTVLLLLPAMAYGQTKLLRFPDIHGDKVVFTYGGDLWIAPFGKPGDSGDSHTTDRASGSRALRQSSLRTENGSLLPDSTMATNRSMSFPDWRRAEAAHLLSREGTAHAALGLDNQVFGWTNDGKAILFRSHRDSWSLPMPHLYTVSMTAARRSACRCRKQVPAIFRPTERRLFIRLSRAISDLRNVTAADRPMIFTSSI